MVRERDTRSKQAVGPYAYKPVRFFAITFAATWLFWAAAIVLSRSGSTDSNYMVFMLLGLIAPAVVSLCMVLLSRSAALKADYNRKLISLRGVKPLHIIGSILIMGAVIVTSILISLLFGGSTDQFTLVGGFSFSIGSVPTLLTLIVAALLEEFGWRGYAQDAIASGRTWFKASIIFGVAWSLWHLPLIFIEGTYHYEILQMNPLYAVNFFVSVVPMGIVLTWVYVKSGRSMFSCMIFHFFVNFMQEQIAMTQTTKCIESLVVVAVAAIIVLTNKELFFEKKHIGNMLGR